VHPPLSLLVQLRVLDRLSDLRGDREQELDLVSVNSRARACGRSGALEPLAAREDRHREDRLVLVLGQVREVLEARVEVRLRAIITGARAAAAEPVIPSPGRMRGRRVISSTLRPCVARSTSSPRARRRGRRSRRRRASASATFVATSESTSSRSSVELTASIVSVRSAEMACAGNALRRKRTLETVMTSAARGFYKSLTTAAENFIAGRGNRVREP
jgi:hypothetical protein